MKTKFVVKYNSKALMREINSKNGKRVSTIIKQHVTPQIHSLQEQMVEEFNSHPVTVELDNGANSENTSGLLGGYGNLFSFIGFKDGSNPTNIIRKKLQKKMNVSVVKQNDNGIYSISMDLPTTEQLDKYAETIPWLSGRGWISAIEKGLSGLGRYLYDEEGFKNSRSFTGIQVKKVISGVKLSGSKYMTEILNNFRKNLTKIK